MMRNFLIVIAMCAVFAQSQLSVRRKSAPTNEDTRSCGVSKINSGLIVRGENFPRGTFPWIVALIYTAERPHKLFCGGTLISKTFVISAAHCILNKHASERFLARDILAVFGAHDLSLSHESGTRSESPKRIYIHDDWNHQKESFDADVSLLEFEDGDIRFGAYIQPICLWNSESEPSSVDNIVSGWGRSEDRTRDHENVPKLVKAPIQNNEECFFDENKFLPLSSSRTFCAGLKNGSGVCTGDSGGGLFFKMDGRYHLKGIVSSSLIKDATCDVSRNAIYTNVPKFLDWIRAKTGISVEVSTQSALQISTQRSIWITKASTERTTTTYAPITSSSPWAVFCDVVRGRSDFLNRDVNVCFLNQTFDNEAYDFESAVDTTIERFVLTGNEQSKYLPKNIGEKLPNLLEFGAWSNGIVIVRDYYFEDLSNLRLLSLFDNKIETVEAGSFDDLINLELLSLSNNLIETLDLNLFDELVKLEKIHIENNKIKFLGTETFVIPGGILKNVKAEGNVCINKNYGADKIDDLDQLKVDLTLNCQETTVFRKSQVEVTIEYGGNVPNKRTHRVQIGNFTFDV